MEWICPKCQCRNDAASGICSRCYDIRPSGAQVFESDSDRAIAEFALAPRPNWARRMFSFGHRITRRDFALACVAITLLKVGSIWASVLVNREAAEVASLFLYATLTAALFLAAGKRCRDMGVSPWWGLLCTMIAFGLIVLLFGRGTKGANRYGQDPRPLSPR